MTCECGTRAGELCPRIYGDAVCKRQPADYRRIPWEDLGAQRRVMAVSPAEMKILIRLGVVRVLVPIFEEDPLYTALSEDPAFAEDPHAVPDRAEDPRRSS